jgi:hypothetical protein
MPAADGRPPVIRVRCTGAAKKSFRRVVEKVRALTARSGTWQETTELVGKLYNAYCIGKAERSIPDMISPRAAMTLIPRIMTSGVGRKLVSSVCVVVVVDGRAVVTLSVALMDDPFSKVLNDAN